MANKKSSGPKAKAKTKRKPIKASISQIVLLEAGYKCANPTCRGILTLELHHIVWVKDGGANSPENLLALCSNCHTLHTKHFIPDTAIRAWKELLVSLTNPNRASADLLLVLYHEEERVAAAPDPTKVEPPFRFSGDGLPALAALMVSGLVLITKRFSGAAWFGGGSPTFQVGLTPRGKALVHAWKAGQPAAIKAALEMSSAPIADRMESGASAV